MAESETSLSYSDRMQNIIADPELQVLDQKYEPYLDLHQTENLMDACDIIPNPSTEPVTGKLIWKEGYDYPIEIKRDIITLYNRHFVD
ncbi:hypothetical protein HDF19_06695 [Mucilaginibacter sp. E4BP6]|uniref:hypothetical protein n=1 Tax=Mucilaginibacter sp. E4BP6 TaxID=2723089 RepID=UPI0015C6B7D0|nr:hypothetical protein [Mucilaginibacter sp. E4BP6]NYE68417.1 hypothetical protein [Mucilaginibacter sp. E4BP6]